MKKRLAGGGSVLSGSDFEDGRQLRTETACTTSACYPARYETRRACSTAANRYGSYDRAPLPRRRRACSAAEEGEDNTEKWLKRKRRGNYLYMSSRSLLILCRYLFLFWVRGALGHPLTPLLATVTCVAVTCCRSACTLQHACCCGVATCSSAGRSHAQLQ